MAVAAVPEGRVAPPEDPNREPANRLLWQSVLIGFNQHRPGSDVMSGALRETREASDYPGVGPDRGCDHDPEDAI